MSTTGSLLLISHSTMTPCWNKRALLCPVGTCGLSYALLEHADSLIPGWNMRALLCSVGTCPDKLLCPDELNCQGVKSTVRDCGHWRYAPVTVTDETRNTELYY